MAEGKSRAEERVDEIERTWSSAPEETLRGMLEELRRVIEGDPRRWSGDYRARADSMILLIVDKLPTPHLDD